METNTNSTSTNTEPHNGSGIFWPSIGLVCETRGVFEWLNKDGRRTGFVRRAWRRYLRADWGALDDCDKQANNLALSDGSRILAAYWFQGRKVYIITEAENDNGEREYTTVLFPSEY